MNISYSKKLLGFTIIELLLVISVLGALALLVTNLAPATFRKSRDVKRKSDLKNITTALEIFYTDHGVYPDSFNESFAACPLNTATGVGTGCNWGTSQFYDTSGHTYYSILPADPGGPKIPGVNGTRTYVYTVSPAHQAYRIYANLENNNDANSTPGITINCMKFLGPIPGSCPGCECDFVLHSPNTGNTSGLWP